MTMFDWQAENRVVSKWIWVYAALTLPVTVILLITWLLFMKKNGLRHKEQELVVAETYGDV
jgi:ABC-type phosphate transport system auxiliary subunit